MKTSKEAKEPMASAVMKNEMKYIPYKRGVLRTSLHQQ
jgi:hypothetical protein